MPDTGAPRQPPTVDQLPRTGASTDTLVRVAAALLSVGAVAAVAAQRRLAAVRRTTR